MEEHIMNQLILEEVLDYLNFKLDEVYKEKLLYIYNIQISVLHK